MWSSSMDAAAMSFRMKEDILPAEETDSFLYYTA